MVIFIDESGDPGFKITKGSTEYFVIVLVIFDDNLDAEETALRIKRYRRSIGKGDKFEFKFSRSSHEFRKSFLKEIKDCNFKVRALVVDKKRIYSPTLQTDKQKFYNYCIKQVLKHNNNSIIDASIRIDGLGERSFRRSLLVYLRQELNQKDKVVLKNLRFRNSNNDVLIQLADMVAGSIKKSYDPIKKDNNDYRKIIKSKIEDVWEFK